MVNFINGKVYHTTADAKEVVFPEGKTVRCINCVSEKCGVFFGFTVTDKNKEAE